MVLASLSAARRKEILIGIGAVAAGILVFVLVPSHAGRDGFAAIRNVQSSGFFPIMMAAALIAVGLAHSLLAAVRTPTGQAAQEKGVEAPWRVALVAASLILYYFAIPKFGTVLASVLAIGALAAILGYRRPLVAIAVALVVPSLVWIAFRHGLYVLLPTGDLFR